MLVKNKDLRELLEILVDANSAYLRTHDECNLLTERELRSIIEELLALRAHHDGREVP